MFPIFPNESDGFHPFFLEIVLKNRAKVGGFWKVCKHFPKIGKKFAVLQFVLNFAARFK